MKIPQEIITLAVLLLASPAALRAAEPAKPQTKPNIVYILVDDAGYGDFGCYGQETLLTPNVDRLASEGMKFTRHYAGSTVCAPSRCVLMTGLHTGRSRVRANGPRSIPDTDLTVPRLLKDAGYVTACIGKYGLGMPLPLDDPQNKGFDYFFGYVDTAHAHNTFTTYLIRNGAKVPLDNKLIVGSENKPGTGVATADGRKQWAPQLLAEDVQRRLDERAKDRRKPFFLYFSSDNGPHQEGGHHVAYFQSNDGLTGMKRDLTEGGVREPFIVRWPGKIKAGTVSEHVSGFQDLMPTVADLAGVKVTADCDGISFLPTLLGNTSQQKQHPYLCWYFSEQGGKNSVLKWPRKLIHRNTASAQPAAKKKKSAEGKSLIVELFNLDSDPTESKNVAPENPQLVKELETIMHQSWRDPS